MSDSVMIAIGVAAFIASWTLVWYELSGRRK